MQQIVSTCSFSMASSRGKSHTEGGICGSPPSRMSSRQVSPACAQSSGTVNEGSSGGMSHGDVTEVFAVGEFTADGDRLRAVRPVQPMSSAMGRIRFMSEHLNTAIEHGLCSLPDIGVLEDEAAMSRYVIEDICAVLANDARAAQPERP